MTMKDSELPVRQSMLGRRDFIGLGAGAAAAIGMLHAVRASAQAPSSQAIPWWAARPGKGGVGKPSAIDMHAHWSPEPYNKALAALGQPLANPYPLDYDLDKRRQWMDDHGDLMHCLTLSGAMPWQRTSAQQGAHLAQIINDTGIQVHQKYPDRFVIGVELPIRDPELALKELNRVAGKPGVRAVHLPDSIEKHDYIFDPGFAPVLARIEALNYPIIFHQLDGVVNAFGGSRTAGPPPLAAGIDAPIEHTLYHMSDHGTSVQHPFRDYLRRFHYDYLIYYPEALRFLMTMVGSDRIVVGTDNFAAKDIEYPTAVLDQFNFPAADRDRILKGNAMRLLHL